MSFSQLKIPTHPLTLQRLRFHVLSSGNRKETVTKFALEKYSVVRCVFLLLLIISLPIPPHFHVIYRAISFIYKI